MMIERIVAFTLKQRLLVVICVLVLIGFGVYSFLKIPLDAFPDVTNIQVELLSSAPGLSPLEVEKFVTYPLEVSMRGLPRLDQLRSVSKYGLSVITIVFEDGVDIYFARQLVLERLIEAKDKVPPGVEIALGPVSTAMGEIYQYTLERRRTGRSPRSSSPCRASATSTPSAATSASIRSSPTRTGWPSSTSRSPTWPPRSAETTSTSGETSSKPAASSISSGGSA
jgi:cobalt-zinc-cadmium resistance protein CzcA